MQIYYRKPESGRKKIKNSKKQLKNAEKKKKKKKAADNWEDWNFFSKFAC